MNAVLIESLKLLIHERSKPKRKRSLIAINAYADLILKILDEILRQESEKLSVDVASSVYRIRKAGKHLKEMPRVKQIDLMELSGALTPEQAETAKKKLEETRENHG